MFWVATKLITVFEDDLDGTEAEETVRFQLNGTAYEIDLNTVHAGELRTVLRRYIDAGWKQGTGTATRRRRSSRSGAPTTAEVRAWAQDQGIKVNSHGRVGAEILAQYEAAH